jgi:L-gulono-1,4-lactone dehydrogenase
MGIIYSYILEVAEMYWLKESKTMYKWSDIKPKLLDKSLLQEARHVMVLVNPYETKGDHTCLVTRINITSDKPQNWLQKVRSLAARKWSEMRIIYWYARLKFWLFSGSTPKLIDRSIRSLRDESYINKAHYVLYQGSEFVKERAFDAEFAFDMNADYVNVIEKIFETTKHFKEKGKIYMTSPVGMRFVKASGAFLAPEYNRDICYVDTPFLQGTVGADELLEACQDLMFAGGGFPHWGKKNSRLSAHIGAIAKTFPKLEAWKAIRKKYDPVGLFANNYTARFLLT